MRLGKLCHVLGGRVWSSCTREHYINRCKCERKLGCGATEMPGNGNGNAEGGSGRVRVRVRGDLSKIVSG